MKRTPSLWNIVLVLLLIVMYNRTLDVLQAAFRVDTPCAAELLGRVEGAQFAEVCPVAG